MGQGEIVDLLREKKEFMTIKEISDSLDIRRNTVCRAINILYRWKDVKRRVRKISTKGGVQKVFTYKINN